jgi:type IX secretion system substrate protein/Kelch motif protein
MSQIRTLVSATLILLLVHGFSNHSNQNSSMYVGIWTQGALVFPGAVTGEGITYMRNDTAWLFFMGSDTNWQGFVTAANRRYNVNTDTWTLMAPLPTPLMLYGMARLKDSIYTIGGHTANWFSNQTAMCRKYVIPTDAWSTIASLPVVNGGNKSFGYQDSLIYCIGGMAGGTSTGVASVYVYNIYSNIWRTATPLPAPRIMGACTVKGDTIIYVGGGTTYYVGYNTVTFMGLISQTDRSVITWTTGANYPGISGWRYDARPWGCKGIIIAGGGGNVTFSSSNECYVFSPGLNTWTQQTNVPFNCANAGIGSVGYSNGIWKLIIASGTQYPNSPWIINNTQILTDTLCGPVGVTQNNSEIPENYSLSQNYPNPFNPTTNISYNVPKGSYVKLIVYDWVGREVTFLVNEYSKAGTYDIEFDGSNLSSGVYFYRIETGGFNDTKKMILIK